MNRVEFLIIFHQILSSLLWLYSCAFSFFCFAFSVDYSLSLSFFFVPLYFKLHFDGSFFLTNPLIDNCTSLCTCMIQIWYGPGKILICAIFFILFDVGLIYNILVNCIAYFYVFGFFYEVHEAFVFCPRKIIMIN